MSHLLSFQIRPDRESVAFAGWWQSGTAGKPAKGKVPLNMIFPFTSPGFSGILCWTDAHGASERFRPRRCPMFKVPRFSVSRLTAA
jgi:hypothetical protein